MKVLSANNISDIKKKIPTVVDAIPLGTSPKKNVALSAYWGGTMFQSGFLSLGDGADGVGYSNHVVLGANAKVGSMYSVALGYGAKTTRGWEVNIGSANLEEGMPGYAWAAKTRILGGVHDGELDTDACTVGQLNALVANYTPLTRTINGKTLETDITLTAANVGALSTTGGQMLGTISAAPDTSSNNPVKYLLSSTSTTDNEPFLRVCRDSTNEKTAGVTFSSASDNIQNPKNRLRINGVATPTADSDACPKDYVDSKITLSESAQTMLGNLASDGAVTNIQSSGDANQAIINVTKRKPDGSSLKTDVSLPVVSSTTSGCITAEQFKSLSTPSLRLLSGLPSNTTVILSKTEQKIGTFENILATTNSIVCFGTILVYRIGGEALTTPQEVSIYLKNRASGHVITKATIQIPFLRAGLTAAVSKSYNFSMAKFGSQVNVGDTLDVSVYATDELVADDIQITIYIHSSRIFGVF